MFAKDFIEELKTGSLFVYGWIALLIQNPGYDSKPAK